MMEEERATTPAPAAAEAISRPGSPSPTASAAIAQLPETANLVTSATGSPQLKPASPPAPTDTPTLTPATTTEATEAPAQELDIQDQVLPNTPTAATATAIAAATAAATSTPPPPPPQPTLTPTSTSAPMQFPLTYATAPTVEATVGLAPASASVPMPAPTQMQVQVPIVAPLPVAMNNHIVSSPAAHAPTPSGNLPTCQNCSTSTTPLWRRDEMGSVLCNACGLFLKLHGRPRPISLKTDVIKSRNRVKTMRPDMQKKKQGLPAGHNGNNFQSPDAANAAATAAALAAVRASQQKVVNGHGNNDSPLSRTATPNVYDPSLTAFQAMDHFQPDSLHYPLPGNSPGRAPSPTNGEQQSLDAPQTHEQLIAANSSLKTRVSELDLINELYRGRLQQLEQDNQTADNYRHSAEMSAKEAATERAHREEIQRQLDDSHRRENSLKRRLDEMEQELQELKSQMKELESDEPAAKRMKLEQHAHDEADHLTAALQGDS
ncbi:putative GATA zinc finger [Rosellinia necatrix]|uniref:Putative GATA zinc finger n=1 Tax=Rosellinia necatrix TaxID=77044 RepID=A0A1W2TFS2_ROSNE|nr:putative GATA zinc finger [Rosellinia necatrix]